MEPFYGAGTSVADMANIQNITAVPKTIKMEPGGANVPLPRLSISNLPATSTAVPIWKSANCGQASLLSRRLGQPR